MDVDDGPARIGADVVDEVFAGGRGDERRSAMSRGGGGDRACGGEVERGTELVGDDGGAFAFRVRALGAVVGEGKLKPPLLAFGEVLDGSGQERGIGQAGAGELGEGDGERSAEEIDGGAGVARISAALVAMGVLDAHVRAARAAAFEGALHELHGGGFACAAGAGEEDGRCAVADDAERAGRGVAGAGFDSGVEGVACLGDGDAEGGERAECAW